MPNEYSATIKLPKTTLPMQPGLQNREPEIIDHWNNINLYSKLREDAIGKNKFVLHDGPPYANGDIHIGHALNKILKDITVRSKQMSGYDANYVPGWDCHGLPIEWQVEKEFYHKQNKSKPDFNDAKSLIAFRQQCRKYADKWVNIQRDQFKRLGVVGDWNNPYLTMSYAAEAQIAKEIHKFAANGLLYRGSKPIMWSVVEKTALAEAEIVHKEYTSDTILVAFPLKHQLFGYEVKVLIWTTTPWTIPGNRAIAFSNKIDYSIYEIVGASDRNQHRVGERYILADKLAADVFSMAKVTEFKRINKIDNNLLTGMMCLHPLSGLDNGYMFDVPLLHGNHVTDDVGTGFVHTAPGHGREDFDVWMSNMDTLFAHGIDTIIPYTVDENGLLTNDAPGFVNKCVLTVNGDKGDANDAVIKALADRNALLGYKRLKHQYPHSWRSKKPVIFRNTPQWFIAMDKRISDKTLRETSLTAIDDVKWLPDSGKNRIRGMINAKPDWVMSRQRAWGVPIALFVHKDTNLPLIDDVVNARISLAFNQFGADCWYDVNAKERFLAPDYNPDNYEKINDILDVWFDSGSTHSYVLNNQESFPGLCNVNRRRNGGNDTVMYLEGSDQHRGWFQSSLLESCGTVGFAPFDIVLTHGFTLDSKGIKMSKSDGNVMSPNDVIRQYGADVLRLWVASTTYTDDQRIGPEILKGVNENYRKLRNTLRWMLGSLSYYDPDNTVQFNKMDELDRLMLHKLAVIATEINLAYSNFDYAKVVTTLSKFMNTELSAFYFDIRKDVLYCDPTSSTKRKGALEAINYIFKAVTVWLAPILVFTTEDLWAHRYSDNVSVHLEQFLNIPTEWIDVELEKKWDKIRKVRQAVTAATEQLRITKEIGSALDAHPTVYVDDEFEMLSNIDFAEVCIVSDVTIVKQHNSTITVTVAKANGIKCQRSWKYFDPTTANPAYPDVTPRDAQALLELGL